MKKTKSAHFWRFCVDLASVRVDAKVLKLCFHTRVGARRPSVCMRRRKLLFFRKKTVLLIKWLPGVRFRFRKKPRSQNSMYYNIFTTTKPFDTFSIFEIFWNLIPSMCPNSKLDQNHAKTHKQTFPIKPKHYPTILHHLFQILTVKTSISNKSTICSKPQNSPFPPKRSISTATQTHTTIPDYNQRDIRDLFRILTAKHRFLTVSPNFTKWKPNQKR